MEKRVLRTYTVYGLPNRPDAVVAFVVRSDYDRQQIPAGAVRLMQIRALSGSAARREWRKRGRCHDQTY